MPEDPMIQSQFSTVGQPDYILRDLDESRMEEVLEAYSLLQDAMGTDSVEDLRSFRRTVSPLTDRQVLPRIVCAFSNDEMIGIVVGATLKKLNAGFIAYSAVKEASRRRGIYATMRNAFLGRLIDDGVQYLVSELEEEDWLFEKYVRDWNALDLPVFYEQPKVQGLQAKPLRLVAQPIKNGAMPDATETVALVREIYERIYGVADVDGNESFLKVLSSSTSDNSLGPKQSNGDRLE